MRHYEMQNVLGVHLWIEVKTRALVSDDWDDEYGLTPDMLDKVWETPYPQEGNPWALISKITGLRSLG